MTDDQDDERDWQQVGKLNKQLLDTIRRADARSADGLMPPQIIGALMFTVQDVLQQQYPACARSLIEGIQQHLASLLKEAAADEAKGNKGCGPLRMH
jgi:hypothetical protein